MPVTRGANSRIVQNNSAGIVPAQIRTLERQGKVPIKIPFDIVAREGAFTDTTIANYSLVGQGSSAKRAIVNEADKLLPEALAGLRGELTTKFESVTPRTMNFDIIFRGDAKQPPTEIKNMLAKLQSLCYPRLFIAANPPLCMLEVANLYSLEGYVTQVLVNWHNTWHMASGLPMGCDVNLGFLMHQYPTHEEVRAGAGFHSNLLGDGFSGTPESSDPTSEEIREEFAAFGGTSVPGERLRGSV